MTYSYERLINLMKDCNLQFENMVKVGFADYVFEAGLLMCRRASTLFHTRSYTDIISGQLLLSAMCLSVVRDHLV